MEKQKQYEVMRMKRGLLFIQLSLVYFCIAIIIGLVMSIQHNYVFTGVHVHVNLLGWVSMALFGILYKLYPEASETKLATFHLYAYNIFFPLMMIGLSLVLMKYEGIGTPITAVSSIVVVLATIVFTWNFFKVKE